MIRSRTTRARSSRTATIGLGLLLGSTLLGGCATEEVTGSDSASAPAGTSAAAPTSEAASGGAGSKVSAEEFCAGLEKLQPQLDKVGSKIGAMAQLTVGIANIWDKKGALEELGNAPLDEMAAQSCPEDAAAALKSAGVDSFSAL